MAEQKVQAGRGEAAQAVELPHQSLWQGISDDMEEWGGMQIPQRLKAALVERGIEQPAPIQELAMPMLARGESATLHAPTGGGKTLAFLLPMLARLQPTLHVGLQALVLVPTPELALQITGELRWLFEALCGRERTCWFNPQVPRELGCQVLLSRRALWDTMRQDTAVIVSTPSLIVSELVALQWQAKKFSETLAYFMCSNLHCIVMDEVDAMATPGTTKRNPKHIKPKAAEKVLEFLVDAIRNCYRNRPVQLISASATAKSNKVQQTLGRILARKWPKRRDFARRQPPPLIEHGMTAEEEWEDFQTYGLDSTGLLPQVATPKRKVWQCQVPKSITHCFATTRSDGEDRFGLERLQLVADIVKKLKGTVLIFMPESVKLAAMIMVLQEAGVTDATKYRSDIGLGQDLDQLADERLEDTRMVKEKGHGPMPQEGSPTEYALRRSKELAETLAKGQSRVLVAKADTVRGLDLQDVRHVVLLEFPAVPGEYLHLAGRTGRMGRRGNVISVVSPMEMNAVRRFQVHLGIDFTEWDIDAGKAADAPAPAVEAGPAAEDEPAAAPAAEVSVVRDLARD